MSRHGRRHVLGRVHGDVGSPVGHRRLHLGDEHTLATDPVQRSRRVLVASRPHDEGIDVEVRVADPVSGRTQPLEAVGEVLVRGYQVMAGYFELPEATAAAIDAAQ